MGAMTSLRHVQWGPPLKPLELCESCALVLQAEFKLIKCSSCLTGAGAQCPAERPCLTVMAGGRKRAHLTPGAAAAQREASGNCWGKASPICAAKGEQLA